MASGNMGWRSAPLRATLVAVAVLCGCRSEDTDVSVGARKTAYLAPFVPRTHGPVVALALGAEHRRLRVSMADGTVVEVDARDGAARTQVSECSNTRSYDWTARPAICHADALVRVCGNDLEVVSSSGSPRWRRTGVLTRAPDVLSVSRGGRVLLWGGTKGAVVDAGGVATIDVAPSHDARVTAAAWLCAPERALIATRDAELLVMSSGDPSVPYALGNRLGDGPVQSISVSRDGSLIGIAHGDDGRIKILRHSAEGIGGVQRTYKTGSRCESVHVGRDGDGIWCLAGFSDGSLRFLRSTESVGTSMTVRLRIVTPSTPLAVLRLDDGIAVVLGSDQVMRAYETSTGAVLWECGL